jgi:hypothetical protein
MEKESTGWSFLSVLYGRQGGAHASHPNLSDEERESGEPCFHASAGLIWFLLSPEAAYMTG